MSNLIDKEKAEKLRKDKWIEAAMLIEAIAVKKEVVETSLKDHIGKMLSIKDIAVYETTFKEAIRIEKPFKDIDEAYSQVVEIKLFTKDLFTLMTMIILYGPSSIKLLHPRSVEVRIDEAQLIANSLGDLIHQFAAAGTGGIVIARSRQKNSQ